MNPALIVVDVQKEFLDKNPQPFVHLLPNIATALDIARSAGIPVIHVITSYSSDKSDWPKAWLHLDPIWCLEGTDKVEILAEAEPLPGEPVIVKKRFSGFYQTTLHNTVQELGIDTLILCGYSSDVCVRMTAMDAYNRGYGLYLLTDCVHAAREDTAASIRYLTWLTHIQTMTVNELEALLGQTFPKAY